MNEQLKNLMIGVFVFVAIAILVSLIFFLKPSVGDMKQTLIVRFSDINRLNVGTRVLFAGKPVGEVVAIDEIYDARTQPSDPLGRVYYYQLVLKIDSGIKVYNTDEFVIQTSGLLGEKSIAIIPKTPPKGVIPRLVGAEPIYADSVDPFENALRQFGELSDEVELTFKEITKWIKDHGDELAATINSARSAIEEIDKTFTSVNDNQLIDDLKQGASSFTSAIQKVDAALCELQCQNVYQNVGSIARSLKSASQSIDYITDDIASGRGTLGKWIVEDDLYLNVNAIISKINTLMNDVNHYGILFHLNKSWQRTRQQRMNLLCELDSPDSFKSYFNQELGQMNTAMSRLTMLIDKVEECCESGSFFDNAAFQKDFAELLRQSEELNDKLKLYNQQLYEKRGE